MAWIDAKHNNNLCYNKNCMARRQCLSVAVIGHSFIFWQLDCIGEMSQKRNSYWQRPTSSNGRRRELRFSRRSLAGAFCSMAAKKAVWSISRYVHAAAELSLWFYWRKSVASSRFAPLHCCCCNNRTDKTVKKSPWNLLCSPLAQLAFFMHRFFRSSAQKCQPAIVSCQVISDCQNQNKPAGSKFPPLR